MDPDYTAKWMDIPTPSKFDTIVSALGTVDALKEEAFKSNTSLAYRLAIQEAKVALSVLKAYM